MTRSFHLQKSFASSKVVENLQRAMAAEDSDQLEAISSREMESSLKPGSSRRLDDGSHIIIKSSAKGSSQASKPGKPTIKLVKNFRNDPADDMPMSFRGSSG